jgi:AcrR family transcriptional regulator
MTRATRWAGVSASDRQTERRALLIHAAFGLFGDGGESAVSVRSVCRAAELNTRYFYESFPDTDELLGAVYDEVAAELGEMLTAAMAGAAGDDRARLRAGIRAVLDFSSADPRRGKILFTESRTNLVLAARRTMAQDHLRELVLSEGRRTAPESDRLATEVGAAMYAGAMAELAQQWLAGTLGADLDAVVTHAVRVLLPG